MREDIIQVIVALLVGFGFAEDSVEVTDFGKLSDGFNFGYVYASAFDGSSHKSAFVGYASNEVENVIVRYAIGGTSHHYADIYENNGYGITDMAVLVPAIVGM